MGLRLASCATAREQFLVRVVARAAALECGRTRFRPLQRPCDRVRHISHIGRLQSREATAEHRIDWKPAEELEDGGEKRVVWSEHHRRADECCVSKRGPDRQFAFATLADIEGWRGGIGADS